MVDYEEDIGGFKFWRLPNKKPRPSLEAAPDIPTPDDAENAPLNPSPKRGRPPKKRTDEGRAVPKKGTTTELPTRRPTRGTAKVPSAEPEPQSPTARSTRSRGAAVEDSPDKKKKGRPAKKQAGEPNGFTSPEQPPAGTKVALPMADTPVIQRNKELRGTKGNKGRRRSSLQMRGRRASSLIDSGASNGMLFDQEMNHSSHANTSVSYSPAPSRGRHGRFL